MAPAEKQKSNPGESSQPDSRVFIRAFRACILPNKKVKSSEMTVSVKDDKRHCTIINDAIDQEFKNTLEVVPESRVVIKYKSAEGVRKRKVTITHAILHKYLLNGGTEFCVFNDIGSFILTMVSCQSKRPDVPQDSVLEKGKKNPGILGSLQEAGGIASERKTVLERLRQGANILDVLVSVGRVVSGVHPAVDAVVTCIDFLAKGLQNETLMKGEINALIEDMYDILVCSLEIRKYAERSQLEKTIEGLENLANEVKDFVEEYNGTSQTRGLLRSFLPGNQDGVDELKEKLATFKQRFDRGVAVRGFQMSGRVLEELQGSRRQVRDTPVIVVTSEDEKLLSSLIRKQSTRPALRCLENTRLGIRHEINNWADDFDAHNVLLMTGYPGVGKSTVAFQAAYDLSGRSRFGLIVDFDRTSDIDPEVVWSTFAYEIAEVYPACRKKIVQTLKNRTFRLENATASDILRRLVIDPLKECRSAFQPCQFPVFVLDALDECGGLDRSMYEKRRELLSHIREWSKLPREFKLIVTSRDESDILDAFKSIPHKKIEMKIGSEVSKESTSDIRLYIKHAFENIVGTPRTPLLPTGWPGSDIENELAQCAGGVFIWAVTALKFIEEEEADPVERLDAIRVGGLPGGGVHALYRQILETSFKDETKASDFVKLAGAVIAAQTYLTAEDWARLLQIDVRIVKGIHSKLRSVVVDGDVIRFRHQSFVDFLLVLGSNGESGTNSVGEPKSCRPERFRVDISEAHRALAQASFLLMNSDLCFNTHGIKSSYFRNDNPSYHNDANATVPALAYACEFWGFHLQRLRPPYAIDACLMLRFLQETSLYWVESLGVLGKLNIGVDALDVLRRYLASLNQSKPNDGNVIGNLVPQWFRNDTQTIDTEQGLYEYSVAPLVRDSTKFIRYFYPAISVNAAHIYISALPFSPRSSRLSHVYTPKFKNVMTVDTGRLLDWPAEQILIRGTRSFSCAVFSHNSNLIASGSSDTTVSIWDSGTGELVVGPLYGHTGWVTAIAFSLDSRRVVSGSDDKSIRIWEVETGEMLVRPLTGHNYRITSVAFSHDGKYVASGSANGEIRIWDVDQCGTTRDSRVNVEDYRMQIVSVTFSSDDEHLISGSYDDKVVIWNVRSGALVAGPFDCHSRYFCTVPISIESKYVVAGSGDDAVQVWDMESKKVVGKPFQGHNSADLFEPCSFSRDGTRVAVCSRDKSVRVCDVKTGETIAGPFRGHSQIQWYNMNSVSFSHDDKRILSCSTDGTIRIWDSEVGESVQDPLQGHTDAVNCVALSYDGKWIVSGSGDKTVRIWETLTGKMVGRPLKGHRFRVLCVAISPNGKRVVSCSVDETIRVWSTKTSKCLFTRRHKGWVNSVAFSHDGRRIVSGSEDRTAFDSEDNTIRIWNADTGDLTLPPINAHSPVFSVAFSHDDTRVVSGSRDNTIRIWNVETGEMIGNPFIGHQGPVRSVAFSHDSKLVVSGSEDKTVRIWDVETGEMVAAPFKRHKSMVWSVAFSADDKLVVSGSLDRTIRVWNVELAMTVLGPLKGHKESVYSVAISNNGCRVVSGSDDSTIRVWDLKKLHGPFTHDKQLPDEDGWVKSKSGELLFWVPRIHRHSFCGPRNLVVIGQHPTRVNYSHVHLGEDWTKCYTSDRCC